MRQVIPNGDLPPNVQLVKFTAPEELQDEVADLVGLSHRHPESGEPVAIEFMFELSEDEVRVLKHEPFLTLTMMAPAPPPFALQTSYPTDPKYATLDAHTHICQSNWAHSENEWWQCDNPRHEPLKDRLRECDACWRARTQGQGNESGGEEDAPVESE